MSIRDEMTADERAMPVRHYIDPGFVNHRLIETIVGKPGMKEIDRIVGLLPELPDHLRRLRVAHIYTRVALGFCEALSVPSLRDLLAQGRGRLFCSTERLRPVEGAYRTCRLIVPVIVDGDIDYQVTLEFGTEHICSDTLKMELEQGATLSIIAAALDLRGSAVTFRPLILGLPWLEIDDHSWTDRIVWWGHEFYENFVEDFDEFERVRDEATPTQEETAVMERITEKAFKTCLTEILGEKARNDWGGEASDHYTAHLHLQGRPITGAFLLKGPARFAPMTLNHLGKNNDQIYRLAQEPADVLFVQHCHEITPAVRATLRAFAVQPSRPRRYCLVDGRDSLRLLRSYGKVDRALELSKDGV